MNILRVRSFVTLKSSQDIMINWQKCKTATTNMYIITTKLYYNKLLHNKQIYRKKEYTMNYIITTYILNIFKFFKFQGSVIKPLVGARQ